MKTLRQKKPFKILLCIGLLLFNISCQKEQDVLPSATLKTSQNLSVQGADLSSLKDHFTTNYSGYLENFNTTPNVLLEPLWNNSFSKVSSDSVAYVYIPIQLYWLDSASNEVRSVVLTENTRKFIVAKVTGDKLQISLITYVSESAKQKSSAFFKNFTGTALIWNLETGERLFQSYINDRVSTSKPSKDKASSSDLTTNGVVCQTLYECNYTTNCGGIPQITTTTGVGECEEPRYEPNACWGAWWSYAGTNRIYQNCYWVEDPPLPDDGGQPGGGSGGSDGLMNNAALSAAEKAALAAALEEMKTRCIGLALYNTLVANSQSFTIKTNANISAAGTYDPNTNTITFRSVHDMNFNVLMEEMFHGYQDFYYGGTGTINYSYYSRANIEFEIALLRDMYRYIDLVSGNSYGNGYSISDYDYLVWISTITNSGTSFPRIYAAIEPAYSNWLGVFAANTGFQKSSLPPYAMFDLIVNSDCP